MCRIRGGCRNSKSWGSFVPPRPFQTRSFVERKEGERERGPTPMPGLAAWLQPGPGGAQPLLRHASPKAACSAPANSCSCDAQRARARARVALRILGRLMKLSRSDSTIPVQRGVDQDECFCWSSSKVVATCSCAKLIR